jgi:hypothetical protein
MNPQIPATGILIQNDWGDAKRYRIACDCGCAYSDHDVWIEADAGAVSVSISTTQKTDYWTENIKKRYDIDNKLAQWFEWFWKDIWNGLITRIRLTKDLWLHGYVKYEGAIIMNKSQALNYAETMKNAVADVEAFRREGQVPNVTATVGAFQIGDHVRKISGGYQASGTIVSSWTADDGTPRYVFRFDSPAGMLHIFNETQLEKV